MANEYPEFVARRIYTLLQPHLPDPAISVNWLAVQPGINRKTLYRKWQSLSQLTPTDLIRQYRLQSAAELLRIDYTVTQTARLSGVKSSSHFASVFKVFYQQTPTDFIAGQLKRARFRHSLATEWAKCPEFDDICPQSDRASTGHERSLSRQNVPTQSQFPNEQTTYLPSSGHADDLPDGCYSPNWQTG